MSTLLISTCENKLSEREFVQPISRIIGGNHETLHYTQCTGSKISHFDKIIICGTALKDNSYLENLDTFKKLFYDFQGSILGICSGMQIVCSIFSSKIVENIEIGMVEVETLKENQLSNGTFQAYNIHNYSVDKLDNFTVLAKTITSSQIVKHNSKNIFGISFHPEVRNEEIVSNFMLI